MCRPVRGASLPCPAPCCRSEPCKFFPAFLLAADIPAPSGAGLSYVLHEGSVLGEDVAQEKELGCTLPADDAHADWTAVSICQSVGQGLHRFFAHSCTSLVAGISRQRPRPQGRPRHLLQAGHRRRLCARHRRVQPSGPRPWPGNSGPNADCRSAVRSGPGQPQARHP